MRVRTFLAASAVSVAAALPLAGTALAADRNCDDFSSQAEAQAAFDSQTGDPDGLDRDNDRQACEDHEYGTASASGSTGDDDQVVAKPVGGVEAGGGPASDGSGVLVAVLGATAAGGVGAVAVRRFARKAG